jgi:Ni,Fe-hydrogenase III small subunit
VFDAEPMPQPRILIAATACVVATAVAIDRGGIGGAATVIVVVALLVFVRVAFRLVDAAEQREEDRARRRLP